MPDIKVSVESRYIESESRADLERYAYAYRVTISNHGDTAAQLKSRHWIITDGNNDREEVKGPGVIGETPVIKPGESYRYCSGAILKTPYGTMEGSYQFVDQDQQPFEVPIPRFRLAVVGILQ